MLLVLAVGVAWLLLVHGNNLKAVYLALTSDPEQLAQMQQDQQKKQEEVLEQYGLTSPDLQGENQLPEQDQDQTEQPEQSQQPGQTEQPEQSGQPGQSSKPTESQSQEQNDQDALQAQLQEQVNKLYQVQATYQGILDGVIASAKQEFRDLPKEKRTQANKISIVQAKMGQLLSYEDSCDAEVEAILSEIQSILKQMGKPNDLVEEIRSYYQSTKANWKAEKMTELYS